MPTPGSPPISTSEPGTRPPPSTRSNSSIPVEMRSESVSATSASARTGRPTGARRDVARSRTSSTIVFHSPQPEHWPSHLGDSWPHWLQVKVVSVLGTAPHCGSRPGRTQPSME